MEYPKRFLMWALKTTLVALVLNLVSGPKPSRNSVIHTVGQADFTTRSVVNFSVFLVVYCSRALSALAKGSHIFI